MIDKEVAIAIATQRLSKFTPRRDFYGLHTPTHWKNLRLAEPVGAYGFTLKTQTLVTTTAPSKFVMYQRKQDW